MDSSSRKSNKIRDIVRLQQLLKKWKNHAHKNKDNNTNTFSSTSNAITRSTSISTGSKGIKFLKKTLSFSDISASSLVPPAVPKGYVAVCVGSELKRFVIPMEYLSHQAFGMLLREAEDEFGFEQEGVLKFPCEVELFEKVVKIIENKRSPSSSSSSFNDEYALIHDDYTASCGNGYSPDCELGSSNHHPQMCR